jgi:hypothetical protein
MQAKTNSKERQKKNQGNITNKDKQQQDYILDTLYVPTKMATTVPNVAFSINYIIKNSLEIFCFSFIFCIKQCRI